MPDPKDIALRSVRFSRFFCNSSLRITFYNTVIISFSSRKVKQLEHGTVEKDSQNGSIRKNWRRQLVLQQAPKLGNGKALIRNEKLRKKVRRSSETTKYRARDFARILRRMERSLPFWYASDIRRERTQKNRPRRETCRAAKRARNRKSLLRIAKQYAKQG